VREMTELEGFLRKWKNWQKGQNSQPLSPDE
jgi:hypothetical protein